VWNWFVNSRARKLLASGTFLQEHTKEMPKKQGKVNLGLLVDG
jgi:hypothetical protein